MSGRSVPCNGCTLCCRNQLVVLFPEMGDDLTAYETQTPAPSIVALKHKANGDCVYLGDGGCTIYERRPAMCREYDCADQWRRMSRNERRLGVRNGHLSAAILRRGREIAEGMTGPMKSG